MKKFWLVNLIDSPEVVHSVYRHLRKPFSLRQSLSFPSNRNEDNLFFKYKTSKQDFLFMSFYFSSLTRSTENYKEMREKEQNDRVKNCSYWVQKIAESMLNITQTVWEIRRTKKPMDWKNGREPRKKEQSEEKQQPNKSVSFYFQMNLPKQILSEGWDIHNKASLQTAER